MSASVGCPRILVVDDEPAICNLLKGVLHQKGFNVDSCLSGKAAVALMQAVRFDAIISDLNMPDMSGLELLEFVKKEHGHAAFLMATGEAAIRIGIRAMKEGADDYILKPFQLDAVVASLHKALDKKRLERENAEYKARLEEMVDQRTIQLTAALKRIELTYDDTLEALGAALDLRDNETAGHSRRVTSYCEAMARKMGVKGEDLKQIIRGAYLHDIGKIGIPDAILLKPGKLDEEERAIMENHVRIGYDLVKRVLFLAPAADIVLTHQERWDGTGYPQGLVGEEIPLGSRIFAVADTLDAMTSDRPYRRALPFERAEREIADYAEKQFDPKVVDVFLELGKQFWEDHRGGGQQPRSLAIGRQRGFAFPRASADSRPPEGGGTSGGT